MPVVPATGVAADAWAEIVASVESATLEWRPGAVPEPEIDLGKLTEGHRRMIAELRAIAERGHEQNPFTGDPEGEGLLRLIRGLPGAPPAARRWQLLYGRGQRALKFGDERRAIAFLEKSIEQLREPAGEEWAKSQFELGVAYLRLAERENCCAAFSTESCILPLRGSAIHTQTEGSEGAIRVFESLLPKLDEFELEYREAIWLLNIAYMTLGKFPAGVPEKYRVKESRLEPGGGDVPKFKNVAQAAGVATFDISGGVVVDDFTGDAQLDIITSTWDDRGELKFFVNNGDGTFSERSKEARLRGLYGGLNLKQADYDNDGDLDLLVLRGAWMGARGRHPNSLLRNDGRGEDGNVTFTDVTFACGLGEENGPTQCAEWADYDNDGDLDLFVGNETVDAVRFACQLFRNDAAPGGERRFVDVGAAAGVQNYRFTKGVAWGDYDGDRFPDLYVSNYNGSNRLYRNNRDGSFSDVAEKLAVTGPHMSFPTWFWDYDNDGQLDLFVSNYTGRTYFEAGYYLGEQSNRSAIPGFYRGRSGSFTNQSTQLGMVRPMLPMGSNFGDLNNDGFPDFYLGTGDPAFESVMPNLLFMNRRGTRFEDASVASGLGHLQKGHGISLADFDNDGDLDIFEQMGGAYRGDAFHNALFVNTGNPGTSLTVQLVGKTSNRSGIGARIEVVPAGGASVFQTVSSGSSFGANPLRQHFGLGGAKSVSKLVVFWPTTGKTQQFENIPAGRMIRITEGRDEFETIERKRVELGG